MGGPCEEGQREAVAAVCFEAVVGHHVENESPPSIATIKPSISEEEEEEEEEEGRTMNLIRPRGGAVVVRC